MFPNYPNNNQQNFGQNFPNGNIQNTNFYYPPNQIPNQNQSQTSNSSLNPQQDYASRIQNFQNQFTTPTAFTFSQPLPTHFSQTYVKNPMYQTSHPTFALQKENFVHEFHLEDEKDTQDQKAIQEEDPRPFSERRKNRDDRAIQKEHLRVSHAFRFFKRQNSNFKDFMEMMSDLEISGGKFTDKDFPPVLESLIGRNMMREMEWGNFEWLRPDDFYGRRKYEIFQGDNNEVNTERSERRLRHGRRRKRFDPSFIDPSDIHQGILGDCYFLSTLSSLAEWPERIRKLFATTSVNSCGCYCIKVCEMGEWKKIIVDDYFPCDRETKKPVFTTGDNELWVLILEKAWAKIYGSYDAIESGLTRECLHDLTGAPTRFFSTSRQDQWETIWSKLLKGEAKHYVMTCDTRNSTDPDMMNPVTKEGLVLGHAYSLLDAYEVEANGEKVRLVKLRNPWGYAEWNGDWSDDSMKWTEELREKLKVESKDDGIFYMEYEEFLRHFEKVQFCYVKDDYEYVSHRVSSDLNHAVYFKIKVEKEGKYYITINQESRRKNAYNPEFEYSTASLVIGKVLEGGQYEYVASTNGADKEVWSKCALTSGEYIVYAKVKWAAVAKNHDFVLSTYGPMKTEIEVAQKDAHFLDKVMITKARESQRKASFANLGEPDCFRALDTSKDGFIYCYYQNLSNKTLRADVYFKEFKGIKLRKPYRGQEFQLLVPPQEERIVLIRILPKQTAKQVLDEKITFLTGEGQVKEALEDIQGGGAKDGGKKRPVAVPNLDGLAKRDGEMKRIKDSVTNAFLNIRIYTYKHDEGVYLFWENLTKDVILDQKVEYELDGLEAIGDAGEKESQFELKPEGTYRVAFRKIGEPGNAVFKYDSRSRKQ